MVQQSIANAASSGEFPAVKSVREKQMEKLELGNDVSMRRKSAPRRHWVRHGRIPTATGESVSDLQALLGDIAEMTPEVAQQLRPMGFFNIVQIRPRMGAGSVRDVPVADRFDLWRQAMGSVPSLGLGDTIAVGALCLTRLHKLNARFFKAITALRAHALKHIDSLGSGQSTKILGGMINGDLSLWIGEHTNASQGDYSATTPPPAGTAFGMPPLRTFPLLHEFVRGGGTLFKLLRAESSGGGASTCSAWKRGGTTWY